MKIKSIIIIVGLIMCYHLGMPSVKVHAGSEPVVKEWKIPFLIFRTGPFAGFAKTVEWGLEKAIEEVNEAGGAQGLPLRVKYYDTALDPAKAVAEMSKVVGDSMIIWGPLAANTTKAAMPLAVRNKVLAVAIACGPDVSMKFQPWTLHGFGFYKDIIPPAMKGWTKHNPDMKTVVQFVWPNDPTWMEMANWQRKGLEESGVKVLPDVECSGGINMGAAVVKALSTKADGYVITVGPNEAGKILKELEKRGVSDKGKIMLFNTADAPALYEIAGETLNGAYLWSLVNLKSKNPRWQKFAKSYSDYFNGTQPSFGSPMIYDMVYLTAEAIDKTGVTGDPKKLKEERLKIAEYMRNYKGFKGILYDYDIINGFARAPSTLFRFENKAKVTVESYPFEN
jgi:branched-chain amino acid transport system substrate-binding protein